ncbi:hypothetical protein CHS0354_015170 [Potamilus streckersoni]|uniref:DNA2/NAM7 helicase helicase domain-containing protein n=1 Tax=Potamilus streckersoni TaxID=2493646 RepID=A0AAE0VTP2_9BIVA|nr:hypothetical protein CHS0354_015170 [Potamilus streckersoni]
MKKKELQDLRLYYDVKIQQLAPGRDGIYHQLEFNVLRLKHVEWAQSKRLLYGSFLCLSSNDFETMLFATVADRDPQDLRHGILSVSFQTNLKDVMEKSHETFVMVESIAFFEAYKHVLCGPPGTGKTYIGLQIVRVLLHNRHVWDENPNALLDAVKSPMLIVCYTNHALDQFLEGIFKFYTGDIVRVGSRSSSETSERHHLDKFRERFKRKRLIPREIEDTCIQTREVLNLHMERLHVKAKTLEQTKQRIILSEEDLCPYMQNLYETLMFGFQYILWNNIGMVEYFAQNGMPTCIIEEWLGCGFVKLRNNANTEVDHVTRDDGDNNFLELNDEIRDEIINTCAVGSKSEFTRCKTANGKGKTVNKGIQSGLWQMSQTEIEKRKKEL